MVEDKTIRLLCLKIIRYNIEVCPSIGITLKDKLFPIIICKLYEDHKFASFEERLEV